MSIEKITSPLEFRSEEFLVDPWPIYRNLRKTDPVHWAESFHTFLITKHDDVVSALSDRRLVSGLPMRSSHRLFDAKLRSFHGSNHREWRKMFAPLFSGASVRQLRTEILTPAVDEVLSSISTQIESTAQNEIEFMEQIAAAVPYAMITRLFGLPAEDATWLRPRVFQLTGAIAFPPTSLDAAHAAKAELIDYLKNVLANRRPTGRLTLLDLLFPPDRAVDESMLGNAALFLLAGTETSVATIGNIMYAILVHGVELEELAEVEFRERVIRETLRWEPPSHMVLRYASTDITIRGVDIPRCSALLLSLGSASRDEDTFTDPDSWRPNRPERRILTFSGGPHTCLGIHLALAEFDTLFEQLSLRYTGIRRTGSLDSVRPGFWRTRERDHIFRRPDQLYLELECRHN